MMRACRLISAYLIVCAGAAVMLLPFVWMVLTALKTAPETLSLSTTWLPRHPQWANFWVAWQQAPFGRYLLNSLLVATATTAGQLLSSILAAFAFVYLDFAGKRALFIVLLATMMVPGELLLVPNFVTLSHLHLIDTYGALIIPGLASVFMFLTLHQAFKMTPATYYDAARLDGASDWQFLWRVLVPLNRPALIAVGLLQMIGAWNAFMWPLIVTNSQALRTLSVGLLAFTSDAGPQYPLLMAAATFMILPMVVLYLALQKYLLAGLRTGTKGPSR